ncbi:Sphingosine kinase 2 [Nowakowskiella sp. JEL0407]|nr:Sphingosine kinase 2 [Nowakowskiella sp. JEL0407]
MSIFHLIPFQTNVEVSLKYTPPTHPKIGRLAWSSKDDDPSRSGFLNLRDIYAANLNSSVATSNLSIKHNKSLTSTEKHILTINSLDFDGLVIPNVEAKLSTKKLWNVNPESWEPEERTTIFEFQDLKVAEEWRDKLCGLIGQNKKRKFLVLLNPVSGESDGKPVEIYSTYAYGLFKLADIDANVKILDRKRQALDLLYSAPLEELLGYDKIVGVGGDGTLHEIINGILLRQDWEQVRKVPISLIPTGATNAFCKSIRCEHPLVAAFYAVRGEPAEIDLHAVTITVPISLKTVFDFQHSEHATPKTDDISPTKAKKMKVAITEEKKKITQDSTKEIEPAFKRLRIYSHLSISWGLVADAELDADILRWIGLPNTIRLAISGFWTNLVASLFQLRHLGTLHFLFDIPDAKATSDKLDRLPGPPVKFANVVPLPEKEFESRVTGVRTQRLPEQWISLPQSWFTVISFMNQPWVRSDALWNPIGSCFDGISEIVFSQSEPSFGRLPFVFEQKQKYLEGDDEKEVGTGTYYVNPRMWMERVKAVILEVSPRKLPFFSPGKLIDIDGEKYPAGRMVHAETMPKLLNVMMPNRKLEPFWKSVEENDYVLGDKREELWQFFKSESDRIALETIANRVKKSGDLVSKKGTRQLQFWNAVESSRRRGMMAFVGFLFAVMVLVSSIMFIPPRPYR